MAIAFDNSISVNKTSATTHTQSFTVGTGENRGIVVGVATFGGDSDFISSVTYNGVTLTDAGAKADEPLSGLSTQLFYLANPASGANNIVVNMTTSKGVVICASSYEGVHQTEMLDGTGTLGANVTTNTVSVTTADDDSWLVGFWWINKAPTTIVSPATERETATDSGEIVLGDKVTTTAGALSIGCAGNSGGRTAGSAIGLAAGPPASSTFVPTMQII